MDKRRYNVYFVRSNPVNPDSRLEKEAKCLVDAGYKVDILCWNRDLSGKKYETKNGYHLHRINIKAPTGFWVFLYWPLWWICVIYQLLRADYDLIHAVDTDSFIPSLLVSKLRKKKIIYDIFDFYPEIIKLSKPVHTVFKRIDLSLMKYADKIVIVDKCRLNQIERTDSDPAVHIIYNSPQDAVSSLKPIDYHPVHSRLKVFYGGGFSQERDNYSMINVIKKHSDISLVIAGRGPDAIINTIVNECNNIDNITFLGSLQYEDILRHSLSADILYSFYDPSIPNNRVASPNKLFEAMMCGIPLITNSEIATADKLNENKCGYSVAYKDEKALEELLLYLRDHPVERINMGSNGRKAYDEKYAWHKMEVELLKLYDDLLVK